MQSVIEIENVTKTYGSARGVTDLTLEVAEGSIFGFLGPNGAGKTTTISLIVDLIRPSSGKIKVLGLDSQRDGVAIRRRIGFLAGDFALDNNLSGWQALQYFSNLRGEFNENYIKELARRLDCNLKRPIKTLSRGNRQKVGLISALMHDPEILIFDEPTSGLDPLIQAEFNKIIFEHRQKGKTTFISSHMLNEVEVLCDRMAFIRDGKLIAVKAASELASQAKKQVHILTGDKNLITNLDKLPGVKIETHGAGSISFTFVGEIQPLIKMLSSHKVTDVTITEADLETIFMEYYA